MSNGKNPFDVGMTGLIGFSSGYYAMLDCDILLMLGTRFSVSPVLSAWSGGAHRNRWMFRPEQIGRRAPVDLGVVGRRSRDD